MHSYFICHNRPILQSYSQKYYFGSAFLLVFLFNFFSCFIQIKVFNLQLSLWQLIQPDLESMFIRSHLGPYIQSGSSPCQGSIIGIRCMHTYTYFYKHTHDFGHAYDDTHAHFFPMIFHSFQNFLVLIMHCLKTYCYKFDL